MILFGRLTAGENLVHDPRLQAIQFILRFPDDYPGSKIVVGNGYSSERQEQKSESNRAAVQSNCGRATITSLAETNKEHGNKNKYGPNQNDYWNGLERKPKHGDKTYDCQPRITSGESA